jgi:hypothetical protein
VTDDVKNLNEALSPAMKDFVAFVQGGCRDGHHARNRNH